MRKPFIAGNWKMNHTVKGAVSFFKEFIPLVKDSDKDILLCPNYTCLSESAKLVEGTNVKLGAQNMCFEKSGAFTGETSALMLKEVGCEYVILGHSERRHIFHEPDEIINKKVKAALKNKLKPILCIGETLEQREQEKTFDVITKQLNVGLFEIDDLSEVTVAYEPVWAIGTGKTATPEQAQEVHAFIRKKLGKHGETTRILYGGSVKPGNVKELMAQPDIDGALVGGASLKAGDFAKIVNYEKQ